jgi:hypothetical protein
VRRVGGGVDRASHVEALAVVGQVHAGRVVVGARVVTDLPVLVRRETPPLPPGPLPPRSRPESEAIRLA